MPVKIDLIDFFRVFGKSYVQELIFELLAGHLLSLGQVGNDFGIKDLWPVFVDKGDVLRLVPELHHATDFNFFKD